MAAPLPSPFFDTHVHFWNLERKDLSYDWLKPGVEFPLLGRLDRLRVPLYDANAFDAETRFANVGGLVLVEADAVAKGEDPVLETNWFTEEAANLDIPVGIVIYTDLSSDRVEAELERHHESPLVRGVRDRTDADKLMDATFRRGYAALAKYGMVYDLDSIWEHLANARKLAESHPDVTMVVEHTAFPQERTDAYFRDWAKAMSEVARAQNAVCKISGLGMADPRWTVESFRPWVEHAIQAFGPSRCFFGSNWPVDRMFSSYEALLGAYSTLISGHSESERAAMFFENAARIYRLPAAVPGAVR